MNDIVVVPPFDSGRLTVGLRRYHAHRNVSKRGKLGLVATLAALVAWRHWRPFTVAVEGGSMRPTLHPGDWLVALAGARPRPGSLVVVDHPLRAGFEMVKRVDHVEDGELWLVGDKADRSTDSRSLGPFSERRVRGIIILRSRPLRAARLFR
jgi:nickel-type superoxide dismutase maturation protease